MQTSWPANPRLENLHWPFRAAHKPLGTCSLPTPLGSLPASLSHTQLLDFPKHAHLFQVSESLYFLPHGITELLPANPHPPPPTLAHVLNSPGFNANITSADQLTKVIMEAALPLGSQSSGKTDGKEYNLLGLKARPWKHGLMSLKTLPGEWPGEGVESGGEEGGSLCHLTLLCFSTAGSVFFHNTRHIFDTLGYPSILSLDSEGLIGEEYLNHLCIPRI